MGFLMLSWNTFSQIDTTKTALPNKILREVAKDLLRYDGCKDEIKLLNLKIIKINEREVQKDTIINLLEKKDKNNQSIITKKDEQLKVSEELTSGLHKELKSQRSKTFLWKLGVFLGVITTTYLILIK
jgi:hypothetical protein